jgi:hypothetical protein
VREACGGKGTRGCSDAIACKLVAGPAVARIARAAGLGSRACRAGQEGRAGGRAGAAELRAPPLPKAWRRRRAPDVLLMAGGGTRKRVGSLRSPSYCMSPANRICSNKGWKERSAGCQGRHQEVREARRVGQEGERGSGDARRQTPTIPPVCPTSGGCPEHSSRPCCRPLQLRSTHTHTHTPPPDPRSAPLPARTQSHPTSHPGRFPPGAHLGPALAVKVRKGLVLQRLADLHAAIRPEVEEHDGVAILDGAHGGASLVHNHKGVQPLV